MARYELIVIYTDGGKEVYTYDSRERAERAEESIKTAAGNQVAWAGIRREV